MAGIREGSVVIARFVAPMSVISNRPEWVSDTLSLKRRTGSQGGAQRWEISTKVEPLVGSPDLMVNMIIAGDSQVVDVEMPQVFRRSASTGTSLSTLTVTTTTAAGQSSVPVTMSGVRVSRGEFIQFTGHNKVYLVTATLTGSGSLSIFPALRASVSGGSTLKWGNTDVVMKARYDSSTVKGMIYGTDGVLQDPGQIVLIEDV